MMISVGWPSINQNDRPAVWRLLYLSGLVITVRNAINFTKAGYVFIDNNLVTMKTTVKLGDVVNLRVVFPTGKEIKKEIIPVSINRANTGKPRQVGSFSVNYKG